jgi:predicted N-acetyltransferase YhbS
MATVDPGSLRSRALADRERDRAIAFLRQQRYAHAVGPRDRFFVAELADEVVAVVRLCREEGVLVLRGMRVRSDLQRQGIGTQLLAELEKAIGAETCYCIAYRWLIAFYGQIGFRPSSADETPQFLVERHAGYVAAGQEAVLLLRPRR